VDIAFIENNGIPCSNLKGYHASGSGDWCSLPIEIVCRPSVGWSSSESENESSFNGWCYGYLLKSNSCTVHWLNNKHQRWTRFSQAIGVASSYYWSRGLLTEPSSTIPLKWKHGYFYSLLSRNPVARGSHEVETGAIPSHVLKLRSVLKRSHFPIYTR
jgi:hypothetical protein